MQSIQLNCCDFEYLIPRKLVTFKNKPPLKLEYSNEELIQEIFNFFNANGQGPMAFMFSFISRLKPIKTNFTYKVCDIARRVHIITDDGLYNIIPYEVINTGKNLLFSLLIDYIILRQKFNITKIGLIIPRQLTLIEKQIVWPEESIKLFTNIIRDRFKLFNPTAITLFSERYKHKIGFTSTHLRSANCHVPVQISSSGHILPDHKVTLFMHSSFNNLCSTRVLNIYIRELQKAIAGNCLGYVVHTGTYKDAISAEENLKIFRNNLIKLSGFATEKCPVLLETSAGQNNSMLSQITEFINFYNSLPQDTKKKIKICYDSCHVFVAGNDPVKALLLTHEQCPGALKLIHFNDSSKPFGSKVDRHEKIGYGFIGVHVLKEIADFAIKHNIIMVKEN